jgi:hypothetical protein
VTLKLKALTKCAGHPEPQANDLYVTVTDDSIKAEMLHPMILWLNSQRLLGSKDFVQHDIAWRCIVI